jgi:hypothetical protein
LRHIRGRREESRQAAEQGGYAVHSERTVRMRGRFQVDGCLQQAPRDAGRLAGDMNFRERVRLAPAELWSAADVCCRTHGPKTSEGLMEWNLSKGTEVCW